MYEHVPQNEERITYLSRLKTIPLTIYLILINLFLFVFQGLLFHGDLFSVFFSTDMGASAKSIWKFGSLNFLLVYFKNEYYRLITAEFLHSWNIHFFLNMVNLYIIGVFVERIFGKIKFFIIYIVTAIFASLASYYFSFTFSDSLGASGAIFGAVGALTAFIIKNKKHLHPVVSKRLLHSLLVVIFLSLAMGFGWNLFGPVNIKIDNAGHIGGLVSGLILGFYIPANLFKENKDTPLFKFIALVLLIITIGAFMWGIETFLDTKNMSSITEYLGN